jgi:hypothetical protein
MMKLTKEQFEALREWVISTAVTVAVITDKVKGNKTILELAEEAELNEAEVKRLLVEE